MELEWSVCGLLYTTKERDSKVRFEWATLVLILIGVKWRFTCAITMISKWRRGLTWARKRTKMQEIKGYGTTFSGLRGFGGDFMVGLWGWSGSKTVIWYIDKNLRWYLYWSGGFSWFFEEWAKRPNLWFWWWIRGAWWVKWGVWAF